MSKSIKEHKAFDEIDNFLSEKETNVITVKEKETNVKAYYNDEDNSRKYNWTLGVIEKKYGSVHAFFNHLHNKKYNNFLVELRKSNGSSTVTHKTILLKLNSDETMLRKNGNDFDAPISLNGASGHAFNQTNNENMNNNNTMQHLGALGMASQQAGLGFNELVDLKAKAKSYDDLQTSYAELKKRCEILEIDNKALSSKVDTAKRELELAVKEAHLDTKSFTDSPAFAKLVEAVPSALGMIMEAKKGGAVAGLGATDENISEAKKQVIAFLKSDQVTDAQAETFYSSILYHMSQTPEFSEKLTELLKQY